MVLTEELAGKLPQADQRVALTGASEAQIKYGERARQLMTRVVRLRPDFPPPWARYEVVLRVLNAVHDAAWWIRNHKLPPEDYNWDALLKSHADSAQPELSPVPVAESAADEDSSYWLLSIRETRIVDGKSKTVLKNAATQLHPVQWLLATPGDIALVNAWSVSRDQFLKLRTRLK